jgi:serine/threonine protein kinase
LLLRHKLRSISPEGQDLLDKMLTPDPGARYSATEALRHPWLNPDSHGEVHAVHLEDAHSKIRAKVETKKKQGNPDQAKNGLLGFLFRAKSGTGNL